MNRFLLVLVLFLGLTIQNDSQAATIYSQTTASDPSGAFASNDSRPTSQRIADNFSLSGSNPVTIHSLRFIGGDGLPNPISDAFRVAFLEDAGGMRWTPYVGQPTGLFKVW